jgi:hypothetical protein
MEIPMTDANNMRGYLRLFEAAAPDYVGPKASGIVSYSAEQTKGQITKITATLKSYDSGRYTKLGRNLLRIDQLNEEIKTLQSETKQEARELVADLFHAEDAASTRVVDTVSFMFNMSKDPAAVGSTSYSKVLKELETHLTPELLKILEDLKAKHTSEPVQKAASLKATDKAVQTEESINEGLGDKLRGFFGKLLNQINNWGKSYDAKLNALKAELGTNESIEEDDGGSVAATSITKQDIMALEDARALLEYPSMNVPISVHRASKAFREMGEIITKLEGMVSESVDHIDESERPGNYRVDLRASSGETMSHTFYVAGEQAAALKAVAWANKDPSHGKLGPWEAINVTGPMMRSTS